jgi:DNA-binding transcriptional ArsR family regulator
MSEHAEPVILDDPGRLKALSHPLRRQILHRLRAYGPATSTTIGEVLGANTGTTSYHLRQLEKYGFIEEIPERSTGRERWWRGAESPPDLRMPTPETLAPEDRPVLAELLRLGHAEDMALLTRLPRAYQRDPSSGGSVSLGRGPANEDCSEWSVDPRQPVAGRSDRVLQRLVLEVSRNWCRRPVLPVRGGGQICLGAAVGEGVRGRCDITGSAVAGQFGLDPARVDRGRGYRREPPGQASARATSQALLSEYAWLGSCGPPRVAGSGRPRFALLEPSQSRRLCSSAASRLVRR